MYASLFIRKKFAMAATESLSLSSQQQRRDAEIEMKMAEGVDEGDDGDGRSQAVIWIVPRWVMCSFFWTGDFLIFGGIILLITSQYKGL